MRSKGEATADGTARCPLCRHDCPGPFFAAGGNDYRRCAGCSLVFACGTTNANFRASVDEYEPAYRLYLEEGPVDASNLEDVITWIESYVRLDSAAIRLLDVGAGTGKLIRRLRRARTCSVAGIEPSLALYNAYDLASLGIESIPLPELAARRDAGQYDVVTVLDVIEHIPQAAEFVGALARVTRPGGFVFLSTPDVSGPLARVMGRRWHHYNAYHLSLYNKEALAEAARLAGFRVISAEHRSKRMSLGYLWSRAMDLQLAGGHASAGGALGRISLPINLRDILAAVWQRE